MVRGLINFCNLQKNATILDPFCGSGTTIVEGNLLEFKTIGVDINPVAYLTTKVKVGLLSKPVKSLTSNNSRFFDLVYYNKYFHKNFENIDTISLKELFYIFIFIWSYKDSVRFNSNIEKAFKNRYSKKISLLKEFELLKNCLDLQLPQYEVYWDESISRLQTFKAHSIDLVLTSPPYLHAIDYIEEDFTQISYFFDAQTITHLKQDSIGNSFRDFKNTEKIYWLRMEKIIGELYRILKFGKYLILVIGTFNRLKEKFQELLVRYKFTIISIYEREALNIHRKSRNIEYVLILMK